MKARNSLGETLGDLSAMAFGLGLIFFTAFPLGIPLVALTIAFAAPVIIVSIVAGAVLTPLAILIALLTKRLWIGPLKRAYVSVAVQTPPLALNPAQRAPASQTLPTDEPPLAAAGARRDALAEASTDSQPDGPAAPSDAGRSGPSPGL